MFSKKNKREKNDPGNFDFFDFQGFFFLFGILYFYLIINIEYQQNKIKISRIFITRLKIKNKRK